MAGALAIMEVMPPQHKRMLGGPSLKVDLHTGALAEGVLTFIITLAVLWIIIRGPRSPVVKTWMVAVSTVAMVVAGAGYTGPAMNPANVSCLHLILFVSLYVAPSLSSSPPSSMPTHLLLIAALDYC